MKRRQLLRAGLGASTLLFTLTKADIAWGANIVAVRMWPSPDYSRVTIESDQALSYSQTFVADPPRLAVDIKGMALMPELRELVSKVLPSDPNIAGVRVGQFAPDVVRLVLDLKQPVLPQVFTLKPIAPYQFRLVFDLYPTQAPDPLQQLLSQRLADIEDVIASVSAPPDPLGDMLAERGVIQPVAPAVVGQPQVAQAPATPAQSNKPASQVAQKTDRIIVVTLDPGHGGEDPGAIGPNGTYEKDVVLKIALKLQERINKSTVNGNPLRAFMTRDKDYFVPLHKRVEKARRVQSDLLISLHADAFYTARPQGASVFALSTRGATSAAARWMAKKENAADLVGGINMDSADATVSRAMLDMSTSAQIKDSMKLGEAMLGQLGKVGKLHKPRVEQAGFAVLKAPDIPSVLVETAFISNPDEERRLNSQDYQNKLADALMRGIERYFESNPPLARSRQI
ncbi:MAG: N-acetylmuramoyl-L-alanine amidase [Burkholderiaceae bacterium]|jgi:N-acetylmuramoyl-L-alanine amidase|nr:N-acetylmuramoyl-L-alanine amidase AmiC precursor [Betaproteobacteria bacterium MOLA814]|tara:strand:+ start:5017 stop:6384 length:1368 start_codon:yes stop_codon:yes gene_type:complete